MNASKQSRWSRKVRARDNNTCQICSTKKDLTAHHLNTKTRNYEIENGVCLCRTCHTRFHQSQNMSQKKYCTEQDFWTFRQKTLEKRGRTEGRKAFHNGLSRCDNPYDDNYWDRAFRFAQRQNTSTIYYEQEYK